MVSAALELAQDITGLASGVGMAGIRQCLEDWLQINGTGKYEDRNIIEHAMNFMQLNADTVRFADWEATMTHHNHAGYKRNDNQITDFWIIPAVFEKEVLGGVDKNKGCLILNNINWLQKNNNRFQFQRYKKGRFYVLRGIEPPEWYFDNEDET